MVDMGLGLPNYPGAALREVIRQSGHPHNVEPLLLTLRRPANTATRRRFAEVGGELVLIEKVTSTAPLATDFKMAVHGQVLDAAEGILYPLQDTTTSYETWLRVEMLDVLRMMIEENLVRSLLPEMQVKLVADMQALQDDAGQHELVRLYAFAVAVAGLKRFHAARPAVIAAGFGRRAAAFLAGVLTGPHAPDSIYARDPFEQLRAVNTALEALYLVALAGRQGDYSLAAGAPPAATAMKAQDAGTAAAAAAAAAADSGSAPTAGDAGAAAKAAAAAGATSVAACTRMLAGLSDLAAQTHAEGNELAPLLGQAVGKLWQLLQDRDAFSYVPPAANKGGGDAAQEEEGEEGQQELTEEQAKLKAAAEEAVAASNMGFEDNWLLFLKTVYDTELVPLCAAAGLQLGAALLQQQLADASGGDGSSSNAAKALPPAEVLNAMAGYSSQPLLALTGSILAASSAAGESKASSLPSILALPGHEDAEFSVLAKSCCACNKAESREVKLLRCGQCGLAFFCSAACQKADWKLGHKGMCKGLADWRAAMTGTGRPAVEEAAAANGSS